MSDTTTKSFAPCQDILFPAFIYGEKAPCRRKMKAEAKKWAKAFEAGREFPEPKLVPLAPGSVVFVEPTIAACSAAPNPAATTGSGGSFGGQGGSGAVGGVGGDINLSPRVAALPSAKMCQGFPSGDERATRMRSWCHDCAGRQARATQLRPILRPARESFEQPIVQSTDTSKWQGARYRAPRRGADALEVFHGLSNLLRRTRVDTRVQQPERFLQCRRGRTHDSRLSMATQT